MFENRIPGFVGILENMSLYVFSSLGAYSEKLGRNRLHPRLFMDTSPSNILKYRGIHNGVYAGEIEIPTNDIPDNGLLSRRDAPLEFVPLFYRPAYRLAR